MEAEHVKKPDGDSGGGEKKPSGYEDGGGNVTVVLQMYMHCVGCAKKVKRFVSNIQGVEDVLADPANNKLMVIGKVDPAKIKEKLQEKTNKDVYLVSPRPAKKDGRNDKVDEEKKPSDEEKKKQPKDENPKEMTMAVLKMRLHCEVCIHKIKKIIYRFKGVNHVSVDSAKDHGTIIGTMDVAELVTYLREKLKRRVEAVLPKKDDDGEKRKEEEEVTGEAKVEVRKMEDEGGGARQQPRQVNSQQYSAYAAPTSQVYAMETHPYHPQWYAYSYQNVADNYVMDPRVNAPQMFSDDNPNACSIM